MKSILVYYNNMNAPGGIERVISNLLKEWVKEYRVILLTKNGVMDTYYRIPKEVKRYSLNNPLVLNMNSRTQRVFATALNMMSSIHQLRRFLKKIKTDYIYTATPVNSLEIYLASSPIENKLIISEHASAFAVNWLYQIVKRFLYPKAYCICVPNKMDVSVYKKWGCRTLYIPHIVTFSCQKMNTLDTKIAINVGRYTSDKRQDLLIRAWAEIKDKKGWKLWIIGEGEEEVNLRKLVNDLNVCDSVFLKPASKDIVNIYQQASLFLFTSRMEGFGMVLLEAMSFGIPCISFNCPSGPEDVICHNYNGFLAENGNKEDFVCKIQSYFDMNLQTRRLLGINARKTVEKWDTEKIMKRWRKIYCEN